MILFTTAFIAGVSLLQYQSELPPQIASLLLLPLVWGVWLSRRQRPIQLPLILLGGFLWAAMFAHNAIDHRLSPELEGVDLLLTGVVSSPPDVSSERTRFQLRVESLPKSAKAVAAPRRILLSWYQHAPHLAMGDEWQLLVRLKRPHGMSNPGGRDYERALYLKGIDATGYIRRDDRNLRLATAVAENPVARIRTAVDDKITAVLASGASVGIVRALVIGDRSLISQEQWRVFRETGTTHLMAISGLHIGIVSGLFIIMGRWLWRRSQRLCQWLPAPQFGALAGLIGGFAYAALAGFAIPCVRALLMLSVIMGCILSRRTALASRGLCLALLVVVMMDPLAVILPGFWLSFGAVAVILIGSVGRLSQRQRGISDLFKVQWMVTLGLAPMLLLSGFDLPLISPWVNLIAVPLFALLLVPMLLLSVILLFIWMPLGSVLLTLSAWLLTQVQQWLSFIATHTHTLTLNSAPPVWMLVAVLLAMILMLLPAGIPGRWPGLLLITPLFCLQASIPAPGDMRMTMLDVGQGLAIVLETAGHVLLYDVGPRYPSGFDTGKMVVIPFLKARGIRHIDRIVVSNGDMDHRGGLASLIKAVPVDDLLSGEPARIHAAKAQRCEAGMHWRWDGVVFEILHPDDSATWKGNNASCVLRVRSAGGEILLTGDIEAEAEAALLARYPKRLSSTVVSVPHHGSATSSGLPFIAATGARYGLISAGYKNRYGFPRDTVRRRWQREHTTLLNTSKLGAISLSIRSDGEIDGPEGYRQAAHRYWMTP